MAVLVVLLAAMLFTGAASAAAVSEENLDNLTANVTSLTAATDVTYSFEFFNESAWVTSTNYDVWINWGDSDTLEQVTLTQQADGIYNATKSHMYENAGSYTVTLYNASPVTETTKFNKVVTITVVEAREVGNNEDAFVFEHIYVANGGNKLIKYSEGTNPTAVNTISGTDGVFYLTESVVNGQYGAYYFGDSKPGSDSANNYIYIWYPEISLQAELTTGANGATSGDSIDGKTINKDTQISFLINSPHVAPAWEGATAKIVFTTPSGGETTVFGEYSSNDLGEFTLTGPQTIKGGMTIGPNAEPGTWTAQAEYVTAPFKDYAKKSNTVTFTVQSTGLTLSAAKDSVIRSNPFTVTIQGDSQMVYFVYLDGASASDNNPTLQPGQNGMKSQNATGVSFFPATVRGSALVDNTEPKLANTYGYFETDASGKRTIQYNTFENTEDKTYTVKVYAVGKYSGLSAQPDVASNDYDSVKVKVEKGAVTISASGDGSYYIGDEITLSGTNTDSDTIYLFITGPNLMTNGEVLKQLPTHVAAPGNSPVSVKTDNTWEYKWDTSGCGLDTGAYTIYATSSSADKSSLVPSLRLSMQLFLLT